METDLGSSHPKTGACTLLSLASFIQFDQVILCTGASAVGNMSSHGAQSPMSPVRGSGGSPSSPLRANGNGPSEFGPRRIDLAALESDKSQPTLTGKLILSASNAVQPQPSQSLGGPNLRQGFKRAKVTATEATKTNSSSTRPGQHVLFPPAMQKRSSAPVGCNRHRHHAQSNIDIIPSPLKILLHVKTTGLNIVLQTQNAFSDTRMSAEHMRSNKVVEQMEVDKVAEEKTKTVLVNPGSLNLCALQEKSPYSEAGRVLNLARMMCPLHTLEH